MIKIDLFSQKGEKQEPISLKITEKYLKLNKELISQLLYIEQNNTARKSGHAKTKGEVSGGGRKPWKQKGTGRARAGSTRSPLFKGGGVTFGPRAISRYLEMPRAMKHLAIGQLLVEKAKKNEVMAVESFLSQDGKTKTAAALIDKILPGKQLFVAFRQDERAKMITWRNIALVNCNPISDIKLNDLRSSKVILFSKTGLEEVFNKYK